MDWEKTTKHVLEQFVGELHEYVTWNLRPRRGLKPSKLRESAVLANFTDPLVESFLEALPTDRLAEVAQAGAPNTPEAQALRWIHILRHALPATGRAIADAPPRLYHQSAHPELVGEAIETAVRLVDAPAPEPVTRRDRPLPPRWKRPPPPKQQTRSKKKKTRQELPPLQLTTAEQTLIKGLLDSFAMSTAKVVKSLTDRPPEGPEHAIFWVAGLGLSRGMAIINPAVNLQLKVGLSEAGIPTVRLRKASIRSADAQQQIDLSPANGIGQLKRLDPRSGQRPEVSHGRIGRKVLHRERHQAMAATSKINAELQRKFE